VPDTARLAFLVSHTHWDREWYLTFPRFRVQLVEVVDEVLDRLEEDPALTHFVLDGQMLALEDYLAVRPDQAERVKRLAQQGRLALGPWYILPDEFLVSAEATVRNLQLGHRVAAQLGDGAQKVGYMPDSFGHLAQLPQILQQTGIDSFIYTRGNGDEIDDLGLEYLWEAPDGSRVLAVNQQDGYDNAAALGHAEIWHAHTRRAIEPAHAVTKIRALFGGMAARSHTDVWLLNNGCDHHPPQRNYAAVLAALREAFPDTTFVTGRFEDYLAALRTAAPALRTWRGELLGGKLHPILSGVWSARMPLKQANARCQHLLADQLEPLSAYAHFLHGDPYPEGQIDLAWRTLLQNHPHDSICGCSTDAVHRAMTPRFAEVTDTAEHLLSRLLGRLCPPFAPAEADDRETLLVVANPLPTRRTEVVDRLVILQPMHYDLDRLTLLGPDGRPVPFVIKERRFLERFWGIDYRTEIRAEDQLRLLQTYLDTFARRILKDEAQKDIGLTDCYLTLQFLARDLPACGHAIYRLTDRADAGPAAFGAQDVVRRDGPTIDNGRLRVTLHRDGRLDLVDLASGARYEGLNHLVDDDDAGDEYDHSPCPNPQTVSAANVVGLVDAVEDTGLAATLRCRFELRLPRALSHDRSFRDPEIAACPVEVRVRLTAGAGHAEIETRFDNRAEDHRLAAWFPTGLAATEVHSDGQFLIATRSVVPPPSGDWVQPHPGTVPQQDFSHVWHRGRGLALLARGLPELTPRRERDGTVSFGLTLLRGVGWLSRDDFPTRRHRNAGPTLATPAAQCPGPHVFHYALAPLGGGSAATGRPGLDPDDTPVARGLRDLSQRFQNPVLTRQGVPDGAVLGSSLLEKTNPAVAVSAIRRHPARDTLVVRLWNQSGGPQREVLQLGMPAHAAWLLDLLEERQEDLALAAVPTNEVVVDLLPHRIVTVEIAFAVSD
jgi:alpha-mannosidase